MKKQEKQGKHRKTLGKTIKNKKNSTILQAQGLEEERIVSQGSDPLMF